MSPAEAGGWLCLGAFAAYLTVVCLTGAWLVAASRARARQADPVDEHAATVPTDQAAREIADLEHLLALIAIEPEDHHQ